jgi:hypothetical protein
MAIRGSLFPREKAEPHSSDSTGVPSTHLDPEFRRQHVHEPQIAPQARSRFLDSKDEDKMQIQFIRRTITPALRSRRSDSKIGSLNRQYFWLRGSLVFLSASSLLHVQYWATASKKVLSQTLWIPDPPHTSTKQMCIFDMDFASRQWQQQEFSLFGGLLGLAAAYQPM